MTDTREGKIQPSPAGLISFSKGAGWLGVDVRTLKADPRIKKITVGKKEFCRIEQLERIAAGEA